MHIWQIQETQPWAPTSQGMEAGTHHTDRIWSVEKGV